jgi:hypothetical protein
MSETCRHVNNVTLWHLYILKGCVDCILLSNIEKLLLILNLGGEWSASSPGRALPPPGERTPVPIVQETGWAPEPVWTQRLEEKSSASVGDRTPVIQSVARHYTAWATRALLW